MSNFSLEVHILRQDIRSQQKPEEMKPRIKYSDKRRQYARKMEREKEALGHAKIWHDRLKKALPNFHVFFL